MNEHITNNTHELKILDRSLFTLSGVNKIISFDNKEFVLESNLGPIHIQGENLELLNLDTHEGTIRIKGIKDKEGHWDLDINITDTYDFTDWKNKDEIYISHNEGESDAKKLNELANILNNFGVISMKYGVLKEFEVSVNIKYKY